MPRPSLKPGQNNIDSRKISGTKEDGYRLQWDVCLQNGRIVHKNTIRKGIAKTELRKYAHSLADEYLAASSSIETWDKKSSISDYINQVSIPAILKNQKLKEQSKEQYANLLSILSGALEGYSIEKASNVRSLRAVFNHLQKEVGPTTTNQILTVCSKWVMQKLVMANIIKRNPITLPSFEITPVKKNVLDKAQYDAAIDYILSADVLDPKYTTPLRGRFTHKELAQKRSETLNLTLFQAFTGLNLNQCLSLSPKALRHAKNALYVALPDGSEIPIKDKRVSERLSEYANVMKNRKYLFGSPTNSKSMWDRSNATKTINGFLRGELYEATKAKPLKDASNNIWRHTLATFKEQ